MTTSFRIIYLCFLIQLLMSCNDSIDDSSKRNENWSWWVDAKSGKGEWIPNGNETTVKSGSYTKFYSNGRIYQKGKFIDGMRADTIFYYDIKGLLQFYSLRKNDTIHRYFITDGFKIQHNQLGKVIGKGLIKNHELGDKWTGYYDNGRVEFIQNLTNNIGWVTTYYPNGNVKDSSYQDDKHKLFNVKTWYQSGKPEYVNELKLGYLNGVSKLFYENGNLKDSGTLVNGLAEGKVITRYENGKIKGILNRKRGLLDGYQKAFYKNGKVQMEGDMKKDIADGEIKYFDENGLLIKHDLYDNGIFVKSLLKSPK